MLKWMGRKKNFNNASRDMITSNWYLNKEQNIWSTPLNFKTGDRKKHGNYFNTEPDHIYY